MNDHVRRLTWSGTQDCFFPGPSRAIPSRPSVCDVSFTCLLSDMLFRQGDKVDWMIGTLYLQWTRGWLAGSRRHRIA
ncbi:hypothetical protein BDR22DRAFT_700093 [Usnea florida]